MSAEPLDTRVINGRFVVPKVPRLNALTIHQGRVVDDYESDVWRSVNASGHLVFPGLIQFGDPSLNAALDHVRGGVTSLVDEDPNETEACLDFITARLEGLHVVRSEPDGQVVESGWNALLGDEPAHFIGSSPDFPVIHFLYHEGHIRRNMSLGRICDVTSGCIARAAGTYPRKGSFAVGSDGDLFVFDPETPDPYRDITWPGRVIFSLLRGQILLYNGQIHTNPGDGRAVP